MSARADTPTRPAGAVVLPVTPSGDDDTRPGPYGGVSRRDAILIGLLGVLALLLGWRGLGGITSAGLDPSWGAALHLAAQQGVNFGTDAVFTYGPLGFLKAGVWAGTSTGLAMLLYGLAVRLALAIAVVAVVRRSFGWIVALPVAVLVSSYGSDPMLPLAFGVALWIMLAQVADRTRLLVIGAAGALAGWEMLGKLNVGVTVLALGGLAAVIAARDRRQVLRNVLVFAGAAFVGGLVPWVLTGQSLTAIPDYLVNSASVISGYTVAMIAESPGRAWTFWAAGAVAAIGAGAVWAGLAGVATRARVGALVAYLLFAWLSFKQGFVRHSGGFAGIGFFVAMFSPLALVPWPHASRWLGAGAFIVAFGVFAVSVNLGPAAVFNPTHRAGEAFDDLSPAFSSSERLALVRAGDTQVREQVKLDRELVGALRGFGVHVLPVEAAVVAGYDLRWEPLPVFQDYQTYTARLDDLNADKLLSDDPPDRILYASGDIGGTLRAWDPPRQMVALMCRYRPLAIKEPWMVLEAANNRCGAPRKVATVRAGWGETVQVPAPRRPDRVLTTVRVHGSGVAGLERIRNLAYKARRREVVINGTIIKRFVPTYAENGLLLSAPPSLDFPGPFARSPRPSTLALTRVGSEPGTGELTYDFYETEVRP